VLDHIRFFNTNNSSTTNDAQNIPEATHNKMKTTNGGSLLCMKIDAAKSGHETIRQTYPQMFSNIVGGRTSENENRRMVKPAAANVTQKATAMNLLTLNGSDMVMWLNARNSHARPNDVNREAELETPSRVACSDSTTFCRLSSWM